MSRWTPGTGAGGDSTHVPEKTGRWSPETQERARRIIELYPRKQSAVMPLLYLSMLEDGYITQEGMAEVAAWVGFTPAQVEGVASFYTMYKREPVGRYLLSICTSISCMLCGADELLGEVEDAAGAPAGEISSDGLVSVEHVECIGACGGAPALQVNYELTEGVTAEKGRELVEWLRRSRPEVVLADELQELFGSQRSFDWAIRESEGATVPVPAFEPYGSSTTRPSGDERR